MKYLRLGIVIGAFCKYGPSKKLTLYLESTHVPCWRYQDFKCGWKSKSLICYSLYPCEPWSLQVSFCDQRRIFIPTVESLSELCRRRVPPESSWPYSIDVADGSSIVWVSWILRFHKDLVFLLSTVTSRHSTSLLCIRKHHLPRSICCSITHLP